MKPNEPVPKQAEARKRGTSGAGRSPLVRVPLAYSAGVLPYFL
jgi:hypothetical protein